MPRSGWLAIGAVAGALAVSLDDVRAIAAVLVGMAAALIACAWIKSGPRARWLALVAGALVILFRGVFGPESTELTGMPTGSGPWAMVVETVGAPREGHQVATLRTVGGGDTGFRVAGTLPRYPPVEPGDRLVITGRARERPDSPYGAYLDRIGAWGTLDARTLEVRQRPTDPRTRLEGLRRDAGELLTRVLPEPEAGLAAGILIGLRDRVDRGVAATFTTAGVSHIVAISGWNVAIVAAAIGAFAGRLGRRRRTVVTAAAIVAYIVFAGASPSVLRAGAMAGVILFARETGRAGRAAAALGWAVALLLLVDPGLIGDAGFQLSTLATGGLIAWATPLTERLDRWTRGRLPRWLSESLGVSLAAQAATLPIVLVSFGRLAVIAPAVNLLVVPLVAPAMAAGLVALLGGALVAVGAPEGIGMVLAAPGWVALRAIIGIVDVAAGVPLASVSFEPATGAVLGFGSALVAAAVMAVRRWRGRRRPRVDVTADFDRSRPTAASPRPIPLRLASASLIVAVAVAGAVAITRPAGVARVTVLDVGQGDAILVEGSQGGRLLVDGGPDPDRLLVELDRRIPPWDRRIDVVVLSHPHEDHVAGLALLLDRYRVRRVLEPGMRGPGPGYAAWLERIGRPGRALHASIAAGDRLSVDEIGLSVLWPIRGQVPAESTDTGTGINNVSVVLLGSVGDRRFLLAGDVEEEIDPTLLTGGLPRLDLLKVAHHGSRTATTEEFVSAVRPRVAIASAGAGNPYGHPARATLERLAVAGARVYRTDQDGSVTVTFDASGMTVKTAPRRSVAAAPVPQASVTAKFLCDVPPQPFVVERPRPIPARVDEARQTLGYHRPDDDPRPLPDRCPALPPPAVALGDRLPERAGRAARR
ncbi:MAG TPA: ComEC/Rec2 family competence protein [Candidatus Limnocylindrales bacterium]|nr:ComEC/Rec2 family competence protein [Candidatus Limnocylindrales bacterium]